MLTYGYRSDLHLHGADRDKALSPVGEKVADHRPLNTEPDSEVPGSEDSSERERGNRRAGLLLVLVGVVLMALAAAEASAGGDGAPGTSPSGETRLESSSHPARQ